MNIYQKYCPNVFVEKCTEQHEKGETIILETKYGKENEEIVHNFLGQKNEFYYYSIVRADGFNVQEWAKRRAERLENASMNASKKANGYYEASKEGADFLKLAEPIKIGHHSEKRHRALIERNHNRFGKFIEHSDKSNDYVERAKYWKQRENTINLSMPESLEFFEFKLQEAIERHEGLKSGTIEKEHDYSLQYANKDKKELEVKVNIAHRLWA